jgi:malonyl-CoA O-methyltransferase
MQLNKAKIRQSFAASAQTYDNVAALQRRVGINLLDNLGACSTPYSENKSKTLLDLGCGTGFLTSELLVQDQVIIALDIALPMLQLTRTKLGDKVSYICADAEQIPLAEHRIDCVFSNLALQWCLNLETVFFDIKRILKPGGRLVFSTFGPKTLQELKSAWATVDNYSHVNEFYSADELTCFLKRAGYTEITIESKLHVSNYDSVMALMQELKSIGAHNVLEGRNKNITPKSALKAMISAYHRHLTESQILATYEIIMVTAS